MPTKIEKDTVTGTETTGHEWDGVKELNTPLPKWWVYVFYATIIWSIGYYFVYPAIPWLTGHTKGLIEFTARRDLAKTMEGVEAARAQWTDKLTSLSVDDIPKNPELFEVAVAGGGAAFAVNCAPCHGSGAQGGKGYPNLSDDAWLWGGTLDAIYTTVQHGIRWTQDDETRVTEMPRFGLDDILTADQINDVAEYVLSLSDRATDPAAVERGQPVFADNCAACHGESGQGMQELGAPRLNDAIWLYGGDKATIVETVTRSRSGVMPAWAGRLDDVTIKQLAVYVHSLGGGE